MRLSTEQVFSALGGAAPVTEEYLVAKLEAKLEPLRDALETLSALGAVEVRAIRHSNGNGWRWLRVIHRKTDQLPKQPTLFDTGVEPTTATILEKLRTLALRMEPTKRTLNSGWDKTRERWAKQLDTMLKALELEASEVLRVVEWLDTSGDRNAAFWAQNVRSVSALRKQYERLRRLAGLTKQPSQSIDSKNWETEESF